MPWLSSILSNVLLALLLALAALFVQRRLGRPAAARILWVLVLVKLITPPLVSLPPGASPGVVACATGTCGCGVHAQPQSLVQNTLPWILFDAWSAGAAATLLFAWRRWDRFGRLIAHAKPAPRPWQSLAARLAADLSIRRPPEILVVPGRLPPLVVAGWRRPRMVLPTALMGRLNTAQREALLLHELVHIRRGDHLVRLLEVAVGAAYWWLPLLTSIGRQLRACEEACCDAAVVAHLPQARREYARLLLDVVDFANPLPRHAVQQATAMSAAQDLQDRLQTILDASRVARRGRPIGAMVIGLACVILPCKLQLGVVGQRLVQTPAPAKTSVELERAAETAPMPTADRRLELSDFCCPS